METFGCPVFNNQNKLYLFTSQGDFEFTTSFGASSRLIATENRPKFDQPSLICLQSTTLNKVFFLNADQDKQKLYYYDFGSNLFGQITLTGTGPDFAQAIIDYDTLVIYAYGKGEMKRLGNALDLLQNPTTLGWIAANNSAIPSNFNDTYLPTMAHAHFNIYFYGVPQVSDGNVWAFRIHYGNFGLAQQPVKSTFKSMHGQACTLQFKYKDQNEHGGAPAHVVFIPDDQSGTFVTNSYVNDTIELPKPINGTSKSRYCASETKLVHYNSGRLSYLDLEWLAYKRENPNNEWKESQWVLEVGSGQGNTFGSNANTFNMQPTLLLLVLLIYKLLC